MELEDFFGVSRRRSCVSRAHSLADIIMKVLLWPQAEIFHKSGSLFTLGLVAIGRGATEPLQVERGRPFTDTPPIKQQQHPTAAGHPTQPTVAIAG